MTDNGESKERKCSFWWFVLCMAILAGIVCMVLAGRYLWKQGESRQKYEEIKSQVMGEPESESAPEESGKVRFPTENTVENPVDFQFLQEKNEEIYAWIQIPGTEVDYPIAQHQEGNDYYLTHNMYREPEAAGCIYTELENQQDFSDPNTIVYGHNMRDGSMFGSLHRFEDSEFFRENKYAYIYRVGHKLTYEVFAAYMYDDRHILNSFDFKDEEVFQTYLDDICRMYSVSGNVRSQVILTAQDKILTLSTCVGNLTGSRYLVQAVLRSDEKTEGR